MKILGLGENFGFGRKFWVWAILRFVFCVLLFAFEFPAKNSEFFRFKFFNFPPTFLDSIRRRRRRRRTKRISMVLDLFILSLVTS